MIETLKIIFSKTKKASKQNLDVKHHGLNVRQICSNEDPMLTFDLFTVRSNLRPMHLHRENVEKSFSQNVLQTNG